LERQDRGGADRTGRDAARLIRDIPPFGDAPDTTSVDFCLRQFAGLPSILGLGTLLGTGQGECMVSTMEPQTEISADEFQALEQKVLRAVEIVRREREARAAAEAEVTVLRDQLEALTAASNAAQTQITTLNQERETVRARVEKMLQQMDELV